MPTRAALARRRVQPRGRWHPSLRTYLIALLILFAIAAGGAAFYQRARSVDNAEERAARSTQFKARIAAADLDNAIVAARSATANLAVDPTGLVGGSPSSHRPAHGAVPGCRLSFAGIEPFAFGHTDVVDRFGAVRCSSTRIPPTPLYAGAPWLTADGPATTVTAPVRDAQTGHDAIVVTAPMNAPYVAVTFLDLTGVDAALVRQFAGSTPTHFVLTRAGPSAGTPGVNTGDRIAAEAGVPSLGWTVHVSTLRADAVADAKNVSNQLIIYLLIAFCALALAIEVLYLKLTRPIQRLSTAVRRVAPGQVPSDLAVEGPAEVSSLSENFTVMARAVRAELTQRQRAEQERDAHAAMLKLIIDSSHTLIYVKDLDGHYLMVNPAFEKSVNVQSADMIGKTDMNIDSDRAGQWRANDVRARAGLVKVMEESEHADGVHYFESVKFPLHDAVGQLYATCGISLDVTEQQHAIAATAEARDAALASYDAMSRAHDAALAANAAKSSFLATMSHEIRTPMNAVIGMADLMQETSLDTEQQEFVETIRTSSETLLGTINNILDYSRIDSGDVALEPVPFSLRDELDACVQLVAGQASAKGLELRSRVAPACPPRVLGDAVRLRQILAHLLSNAVKFTDSGQVRVDVECQPASDDRILVSFRVTDSGIGISERHVDLLFESFNQADTSDTRTHGGSGLGLAISRRLAEAMGGTITVSSAPGRGSVFTLTVTFAKCPDWTRVHDTAALAAPVLAGHTVLVVDDTVTNLRVLELQLTRLGMSCLTAQTAAGALAFVRDGVAFDVAVIDRHMPEMDGIELARALSRLPGNAGRAPRVLLTSQSGAIPEGERLFATLLSKPLRMSMLRDTLTAVLSGRDVPTSPRPLAPPTPKPTMNPQRILVAEDNPVNQRLAQLMLSKLGHAVDIVGDGAEAVLATESQDYDVIFMDVQMPQMDGLEATRRIRQRGAEAARQPHIVAMTASALVEDREACAAAGMEAYLTKPVREWELKAVLDRSSPTRRGGGGRDDGASAAGRPLGRAVRRPSGSRAIDVKVLDETSEGPDGHGDRAAVISGYLRRSRELISQLSVAAGSGDAEAIGTTSRTLGAMSAKIGAGLLTDLLAEVASAAGTAPEEVPVLVVDAMREYERASDTLRALASSVHGAPPLPTPPI